MKNYKKICICVSGLDGSGKTFIINKIVNNFSNVINFKYIWSRFKNYTSKPLLLLTRLTGHNYKEKINGTKIGYHDFYKSKILSILFLFFQWIDQFLEIILRFKTSQVSIIADRCLVDTLVDISIDTKMEKFVFGIFAKSLFKLMPKDTIYIILKRNVELIKNNRPDAFYDKNLLRRKELFEKISKLYPIHIIENDNSSEETLNKISKIINEKLNEKTS